MRLAQAQLLVLWLAAIAAADTQRVVVSDRLVVLEVAATAAVDVSWESRQPVDLRIVTFHTTAEKSVAVFYLAGSQAVLVSDLIDWDGRKRTKTTWIVEAGDVPPPPPPPEPDDPDPPTPEPDRFGLTAVARQAKAKILASGQRLIPQVAANFQATAAAVAAGGLATVDRARADIQGRNRSTFGTNGEAAWRPWLIDVGRAVDALEDAGTISTVKQYGQALADIAAGLQ